MSWSLSKTVIVPYDFSNHADAAVERAVALAESPLNVHVIHILPFITPTEPGVGWGYLDDAKRIEQTLEEMQKALLPVEKFGELCIEVRLGDPGSVIAQRAEDLNADLVVVGSHGRTGIARIVLGSVAERVARLAPCPVLIVKLPPVTEPAAETRADTDTQGVVVI